VEGGKEATYLMLEHMLDDQIMIVEVALYSERAGLLNLLRVLVPSYQSCDRVSLSYQQLQDIPPDEAWADDEDVLC
jgi:hypothetical protein